MSILTEAIYDKVDVTGKRFGQYTVLGKVRTHVYPSGSSHQIWRAVCDCGNTVETQAQKIRWARFGCKQCNGKNIGGVNSPHWKGGRFVPGYFVAKVQTKLSRGSRLIDYSLTLDYLDSLWESQDGRCSYTGLPLAFGNNTEECTASLDRIDSAGGYLEGNVQFVHKIINKMKWDLSDMEFKNFCVLVAKNL